MVTTDPLRFLLPGFLHGLANSLFAVQGQVQRLNADNVAEVRSAVLAASGRANQGAALVASLMHPEDDGARVPLPGLVAEVADLLRVPMRDAGIGVEADPTAAVIAATVPRAAVLVVLVRVMDALTRSVQGGFRGTAHLGAGTDGVLGLRLESEVPGPDLAALAASVDGFDGFAVTFDGECLRVGPA